MWARKGWTYAGFAGGVEGSAPCLHAVSGVSGGV